jgi:uncharacterized protein with HEPN domain
VLRFISNRRRSDFESDQMLLFAVVRAIEVLGVAASKVSEDTRSACPEIPWSAITDMRNRLIHGYFDIDVDIVWNTASLEIPALLSDLRRIAYAQRQAVLPRGGRATCQVGATILLLHCAIICDIILFAVPASPCIFADWLLPV